MPVFTQKSKLDVLGSLTQNILIFQSLPECYKTVAIWPYQDHTCEYRRNKMMCSPPALKVIGMHIINSNYKRH